MFSYQGSLFTRNKVNYLMMCCLRTTRELHLTFLSHTHTHTHTHTQAHTRTHVQQELTQMAQKQPKKQLSAMRPKHDRKQQGRHFLCGVLMNAASEVEKTRLSGVA